ncbi:MAG: hypothetical protein RL120_12780, partial [Gammaproteobacteria bacterium]
ISPALVNQETITIPEQQTESSSQPVLPESDTGTSPPLAAENNVLTPPVTVPRSEAVQEATGEPVQQVAVDVEANGANDQDAPSPGNPEQQVTTEDELLVAEEIIPDVTLPIGEQGAAVAENIRTEVARTPEQQDTASVQDALRLIANNRMSDAFAVLEEAIADNRYAHQTRETYAKLLMSQGNVQGAASLVDAGLQLAPNHSGFKKVKARLLLNESNVAGAVDLLIRRAPEVSVDSEYHDILASAQLANRDYQGASVSYTSLVQFDQTQGKWWYGFAAAQDRLGNTRAARQAYARAMQQPNLSASLRQRSQERITLLGP